MIGAILGDMIGSPYEFDQGDKTKDFVFWNPRVRFTDDSVMTIAVSLGGDCDTLTCIAFFEVGILIFFIIIFMKSL